MKRVYQKPQIVFEDFSLSTSIAACKFEANHSEGSCGYDDGRGNISFNSTETGCSYTPPENNNGVCYHAPAGMELFGSY